jgi:hypothetical protein
MTFRKPNLKRKYTKRTLNTKRKNTKRKSIKRKSIKRKSNKYGGKFTNNPDNESIKAKLIKFITGRDISLMDATDIVKSFEDTEYEYDANDILAKLKDAVKAKGTRDRDDVISDTIYAIQLKEIKEKEQAKEKQAKEKQAKEKQVKETQPPVETQKEVLIEGCPSQYNEPVDCIEKKDYLKQVLIFHPDKNPNCIDEATQKFQALQNKSTCKFD